MNPERTPAARALLAFYVEAGVDAVVGELPVDRFADVAPPVAGERGAENRSEPAVRRPPLSPPPPNAAESRPAPRSAPAPAVSMSPEAAVMAAREAARSAASLD